MQRPGPHPWGPGPHGRHGPGPHPHGPKPPCVKKCMEEVAEVKAECATKMRAIKLAFEAGKITKDQALAKFEVLKQECAEEFEDVFEKCGPHPGPKPHDGPMDLVAMFHNVFGSPEAKSPECDAAIDDMKASCAPTDWKTFDWSKCAEASKRLADKCAKVPPEPEPEAFGAKPSGNPDCDAAIAEMDDACAASDDKTAVYDWKKCAKASKKIAKACSKWGPKPPEDAPEALEAEAKSPECDAAIDDMKASCAPTDWKTFDWSKCAEASKRLADKCAKVPPEPEPEAFGAKPSGNPDCDAAIAEMDDACAASDDKTAVYDWKKCADASKKIAKACSKWGPKPPEDAPEALEAAEAEGAEAKAKPADAACDAALEKMRDACAGPAKDAKDASPYDWKKCADASKAIGAACAKPGPKPEQPFNFLACVAQAKMTESECSYDVQTNLAKEDKFDAYIDAFEQCEPSVDRLVQACQ